MPKLLLLIAACALFACSSESTTTPTDAGGSSGGKDAAGPETGEDAGAAADKLARPPGSLERPPETGLPADLRPPKE